MPNWLQWESRDGQFVYTLDWTMGALVTVAAVFAVVGLWRWAPKVDPRGSIGARVSVSLASLLVLALLGDIAFDVGQSLFFEGMFGRRSSDVIEHFPAPLTVLLCVAFSAGASSVGFGVRGAVRGASWSDAPRYLALTSIVTAVLGYVSWLGPESGLSVLWLEHPMRGIWYAKFAPIHDTADYAPTATTTPGWSIEAVETERTNAALEVSVRAERGPLTSTARFSIPIVTELGDPRLPLRYEPGSDALRWEEVALSPESSQPTTIEPWDGTKPPRQVAIEVIGERWDSGWHVLEVRCTGLETTEDLEISGSNGHWWATVPGRLRQRSLAEYWLGDCNESLCRYGPRRGWQRID